MSSSPQIFEHSWPCSSNPCPSLGSSRLIGHCVFYFSTSCYYSQQWEKSKRIDHWKLKQSYWGLVLPMFQTTHGLNNETIPGLILDFKDYRISLTRIQLILISSPLDLCPNIHCLSKHFLRLLWQILPFEFYPMGCYLSLLLAFFFFLILIMIRFKSAIWGAFFL